MLFEVLERPPFGKHLSETLSRFRYIGQTTKDVWLFAMERYSLATVSPHTYRRPFGVAIALELLQAVLSLWLLDLDNYVWRRRRIFFPDDDVGGLLVHRRAEIDRLLYGDPVFWVPVNSDELVQVELPDNLLRLRWTRLSCYGANQVWLSALID